MKVVILAGGFGTRISEETDLKPKPMVEIGGKPILWHIMKYYSHFGFNDFIICLGYKGYVIKEYFTHYFLHQSDVTFDFVNGNQQIIHNQYAEPWMVTLLDTGEHTMTGGRIKRVQKYLENKTFMLTYGDGVSNVRLNELLNFHKTYNRIVTMTSIQPPGRFGVLKLSDQDYVEGFEEKPKGEGGWINGGFMVVNPEVFDYIENDQTVFEKEPLANLSLAKKLVAFRHHDFWYAMDTLRDKLYLEKLWNSNTAPWKVW